MVGLVDFVENFVVYLLVLFGTGFFVGLLFGLKLLGFFILVTNPGSVVNCHRVEGLSPCWIELWLREVIKPGSVVDCQPGFV